MIVPVCDFVDEGGVFLGRAGRTRSPRMNPRSTSVVEVSSTSRRVPSGDRTSK